MPTRMRRHIDGALYRPPLSSAHRMEREAGAGDTFRQHGGASSPICRALKWYVHPMHMMQKDFISAIEDPDPVLSLEPLKASTVI